MLHEPSEICTLCKGELSELYFSIHGVDLFDQVRIRTPGLNHKEIRELLKMLVYLEPECSDEYAAGNHEMDHLRHLAYPPACPATCMRAQALYAKSHPTAPAWVKGGGKCTSCIKLHGVIKQIGDAQLLSELVQIYAMDSDTGYEDML